MHRARPDSGGACWARVSLLVLTTLVACSCWGAATLEPAPGAHARTELGEIRMDAATAKALVVTEHTCARDATGRLVVHAEFRNILDEPCPARIRVQFTDGQGMLEKGAFSTSLRQFPPGTASADWASRTPDAVSYVVEVWAVKRLPL